MVLQNDMCDHVHIATWISAHLIICRLRIGACESVREPHIHGYIHVEGADLHHIVEIRKTNELELESTRPF